MRFVHRSRPVATLVLAALLAALPSAAEAALRRIVVRPNDLAPFSTQQSDLRAGVYNASPAAATFWKELKLPVGATIKSLRYVRFGGTAAATVVGLDRVNPGQTPAWQRVLDAPSTALTPAGAAGTVVTAVPTGTSRRVARGWTYFVLVGTEQIDTGVGDITVVYSVP